MRSQQFFVLSAAIVLASTLAGAKSSQDRPGYSDTPAIPNSKWKVHDSTRPYPAVVASAPYGEPPSDAIVLFDGTSLDAWQSGDGAVPAWTVAGGYMEVAQGGIKTKQAFGDCQLHIEWASPTDIVGEGQGRGNSGVFFMERYEIQVLDSYENPTYPDGQASALYGQFPPLVNASRAPGEWQTYDIVFTAPRFEAGELVEPARVTVFHNGVCVHHARELHGPTAHRTTRGYEEHGEAALSLQNHGNPVRYRNVWIRELGAHDEK
jgi:hypothetical protein